MGKVEIDNHSCINGDIYTPSIYADRYIVRPFVCSFFHSFVLTSVEFASKFYVKVSQVVYISVYTYQKAFIFGP